MLNNITGPQNLNRLTEEKLGKTLWVFHGFDLTRLPLILMDLSMK